MNTESQNWGVWVYKMKIGSEIGKILTDNFSIHMDKIHEKIYFFIKFKLKFNLI